MNYFLKQLAQMMLQPLLLDGWKDNKIVQWICLGVLIAPFLAVAIGILIFCLE